MRQVTHALLTRPPLSHSSNRSNQSASLDLHVLSTPPAFILSQDQTLVKNISNRLLHRSNNQVCSGIKKTTSFLYPFYCFIGLHLFQMLFWIILCLEFSGMLSIVQLSMFFVVFATAMLEYHIFCRLSTTFLIFFCRSTLQSRDLCDSHIRLTQLFSFVNNFFHFFYRLMSQPRALRDSFVRIPLQSSNVNTIFQIFVLFQNPYNLYIKTGIFKNPR